MAKVLFRGASVTAAHAIPKEGARVLRVKVQADYTDALREELSELEWAELPETSPSMALLGGLLGMDTVTLAPPSKGPAFTINAISAQKFEAVRIREEGKDSTTVVIRFEILCTCPQAGAIIDSWLCTYGDAKSALTALYNSVKKPDGEETTDDRQQPLIAEEPPKGRRTKVEDVN